MKPVEKLKTKIMYNEKLIERLRKGEVVIEFDENKDKTTDLNSVMGYAVGRTTGFIGSFRYYWIIYSKTDCGDSTNGIENREIIPLSRFLKPKETLPPIQQKNKAYIDSLPKEIKDRIMECQVKQDNRADLSVFYSNTSLNRYAGGFDWSNTKEGQDFWKEILASYPNQRNPNHFYTKYPKTEEPKLKYKFSVGDTVKIVHSGLGCNLDSVGYEIIDLGKAFEQMGREVKSKNTKVKSVKSITFTKKKVKSKFNLKIKK